MCDIHFVKRICDVSKNAPLTWDNELFDFFLPEKKLGFNPATGSPTATLLRTIQTGWSSLG